MKIGTKVALCQDGKWSRARLGTVVGTRNGHHILVRFKPAVELPVTEHWFSCKRRNAGIKRFSGWCDVDTFMPWYTVVSLSNLRTAGLLVSNLTEDGFN